jgi:GNAT superfamily N-acetyltransferase
MFYVHEELEPLEIREMGPADRAQLASLWSKWRVGRDADPEFGRRMAEWLDDEGDRRTIWLAVLNKEPVGIASLFEYRRMPSPDRRDRRWGYVGNMFVLDAVRDQGVGTALLDEVIQVADARGYVRLILSPSPKSLQFYARAGFVAADPAGEQRLLVRPGACS